jgi:hypothetical protein
VREDSAATRRTIAETDNPFSAHCARNCATVSSEAGSGPRLSRVAPPAERLPVRPKLRLVASDRALSAGVGG